MWHLIHERLQSMHVALVAAVPRILAGLLSLAMTAIVAHLVSRWVPRLVRLRVQRKSLADLTRQLSRITVWVIGVLLAATIVFPTLTLGGVIGAVGLGSVAIGFAFKDIFENFFAGMLILWKFPFENDDVIECQGIQGRVEDVTVRMTLVRQLDGQLVVMPNAVIFKNPVTVRTAQSRRRATVSCQVAFGEPVETAREVIRDAVRGCDRVDDSYPVEVLAADFESSGIRFLVRWWTDPVPGDERRSRDQVVEAIYGALDAAGISIPFPHRTVVFEEGAR
ncbi:MAG: mechanosensitive ion channel family protein [Myxococcota bacterium]